MNGLTKAQMAIRAYSAYKALVGTRPVYDPRKKWWHPERIRFARQSYGLETASIHLLEALDELDPSGILAASGDCE